MNTFDIIIAAILIVGFVRGLLRGFFVELASLVALIAGIYGAIHFSYFASNILIKYVSWEERYVTIISFAVTFGVIVIVIALLGKMFTKIADFASLGFLNKLIGGIFGSLKFALILSIGLLVFEKLNNTIPFVSDDMKDDSVLYEPVKNLSPALFPDFIKIIEEKSDFEISE
jgi:membrane protein required for colicin V production